MKDTPHRHWESVDFSRAQSLDNLSRMAAEGCSLKELSIEAKISVSLAIADERGEWHIGGFRDDERFYPASVVKVFFAAVAAEKIMKQGAPIDPELERALQDMLKHSINDATSLVVDWVTDTTGGPNLSGKEFEHWRRQRETVNVWLKEKGYSGVSAIEKTWNEGPYGRERQLRGNTGKQTNSLSAHDAVRFFVEYFQTSCGEDAPGRPSWYKRTFNEMKRNLSPSDSNDRPADDQAISFSLSPLPSTWTAYSKAGWTDEVRHDLAFIQTPSGKRFAWAIFTSGISDCFKVIPSISRKLLEGLST